MFGRSQANPEIPSVPRQERSNQIVAFVEKCPIYRI